MLVQIDHAVGLQVDLHGHDYAGKGGIEDCGSDVKVARDRVIHRGG
jgi:hypothetical protein